MVYFLSCNHARAETGWEERVRDRALSTVWVKLANSALFVRILGALTLDITLLGKNFWFFNTGLQTLNKSYVVNKRRIEISYSVFSLTKCVFSNKSQCSFFITIVYFRDFHILGDNAPCIIAAL